MRSIIHLFLVSSLILHPSSLLLADGGAIRLSERKGSYRITVFTAPASLRVGPVDISVLVQDSSTDELVANVRVNIKIERQGFPRVTLNQPATTEAATNKLYFAAVFDLPEPGWYSVDVSVDGAAGTVKIGFEQEVAEPLPTWVAVWPWVVWPFMVILLFCAHQFRVRWSRQRTQAVINA
jgi:hypothetical protein